ncbi:LysE/ArgO family amino acid transporter [Aneurinibacillus thermoaerophilus]|uniref:L-lysine exporter family protein LysE/ArgO n=1 Tax=Aneurinibacillus thermoaerophilus TaxID=143495 RepID=A0A1G8D8X7_ANETH|nr:LysE/ArgO family amino acid transporter [Aneurinibacillus thermoaerophilus]MED0677009.1 LysE/ArgO family amino acid transporter [Aneurinibacillus thermoaerophilus]MED0679311.1 LysE/ArgO family amino acid transporter [Aneurinibacillus thermoaerophilus]MED0737197.1 LysE/ArgO family amino acid transporter [Aneurinibacillus thermoaerophilus]MED0757243.1 LysE/ArgO family amino acid transporter [Aneurinibacillus thermoaerophilus]MED0762433.1 LysE/ArgO family amino acid transporter [Aneurinibacill
MLQAFLHGMLLAFGLILPLGAQNVFVFTQGATQPSLVRALPVILTASLCDTLLIVLAVLGVSLIVLTFSWLKTLLFAAGILFLLYIGWITWRSDSHIKNGEQMSLPPKKQIMFAVSVSLLNPHAILDTIGVIGTSSLGYTGGEKWAFTLSCILISYLWFFSLAIAGRILGTFDKTGRWMKAVNRISALLIWGVACYMAIQLLTI